MKDIKAIVIWLSPFLFPIASAKKKVEDDDSPSTFNFTLLSCPEIALHKK
jgi:hypothetical protein